MSKENIQFGQGSFIGEISRDPTFFDLPVREQAKIIGWANSCPVTDELTDPENPNPGRGPEAMRQRYAEVNFWFSFIARETHRLNPDLYKQIILGAPRESDELVGKYEPENVPEWHAEIISPMGTLAGYALPRIFVEQLGTHKEGVSREDMQGRLLRGLDVLESVIPEAGSPEALLVLVAEGLLHADCSPDEIMKHVFSEGWIKEHNARKSMEYLKKVAKFRAPELSKAYELLSEEEKARRKLA